MNIKLFYLIPIFETQELSVNISKEYSQLEPFLISIPSSNLLYTKDSLDSPIASLPSLNYQPDKNQSIEDFSLEKINDYLNLSVSLDQISIFQTEFDTQNNELLVFLQLPKQKPIFAQHLEALQIQDNMENPIFKNFIFGNLLGSKFENPFVEKAITNFLNAQNLQNFNIKSAFLSHIEKTTITAFLKHQGYFSPDFSTELTLNQPLMPSFKKFT